MICELNVVNSQQSSDSKVNDSHFTTAHTWKKIIYQIEIVHNTKLTKKIIGEFSMLNLLYWKIEKQL